jgi:hypothetical protein
MSFTAVELQEAVDELLLSAGVSTPRLPITGSRDIVATKNQSFDLLATALLFKPESFFYVVWLATNASARLLRLQLADLTAVLEAGAGVSRSTPAISSTAELVNAQAALLNFRGALDTGTSLSAGLPQQVDRFRRAIESFLRSQVVPGLVVNGAVSPTAEEQRERVGELWADITARHNNTLRRLEIIRGALSALQRLRLPRSVVTTITDRVYSKVQEVQLVLESPRSEAERRNALLRLMAARTVMTRAATFRSPQRLLSPLRGDSSSILLLDAGEPPSLSGMVSAPFNTEPPSFLEVSVDGAPVSVPTALDSRAEVRSRPLIVWPSGPTAPAEAVIEPDFGVASSYAVPAAWPSGAAAALDLDTNLAGIEVTWDATEDVLVFRSQNPGDDSHLRVLDSTVPAANFVEWTFGAAAPVRAGEPVEAEAVLDVLRQIPGIRAEAPREVLTTLTGVRPPGPGNEALVRVRVVEDVGGGFVSDGTTTIVATTDLEGRGVEAGMLLVVTAPPAAAGTYTILEVDGPVVVVDADVAATAVPDFFVGPDFTALPAGARVLVSGSADNSGFYRLVSSGPGELELIPPLREDGEVDAVVFEQFVQFRSRSLAAAATLEVTASQLQADTGLPLGIFGASATAGRVATDLALRGVRPGDVLRLMSPSSVVSTHEVVSVIGGDVVFSPAIDYEAGSWSYEIFSSPYLTYEALLSTLPELGDLRELDTVVGRLRRGAAMTPQFLAQFAAYATTLGTAASALEAYAVPLEASIQSVVQMFREQGMDRALDLLVAADITTLFGLQPDEVSYSTNVMRAAATAGREVAPVSKFAGIQQPQVLAYAPTPYDPIGGDGSGQ